MDQEIDLEVESFGNWKPAQRDEVVKSEHTVFLIAQFQNYQLLQFLWCL
jgi:hypothetical protein